MPYPPSVRISPEGQFWISHFKCDLYEDPTYGTDFKEQALVTFSKGFLTFITVFI